MTSNQIKYWDLRERHRNNKTVEKENERSHRANEANQRFQIQSTYNLGVMNLAETQRSNQAREVETNRSNVANESIKRESNYINMYNAESNRMNAYTNAATLAETVRNNKTREAQYQQQIDEAGRHNLATESNESFKAVNQAAYQKDSIKVEMAKLENEIARIEELERHNKATEEETKRKNTYELELQALRQKEEIRYHNAQIIQGAANNITNLTGTIIGRGGLVNSGAVYQPGEIKWPKGYN